MKKCGRFVAGMFGTSLSLAMLSGAFLMANKGAVEAEAAGIYNWIASSSDPAKFKESTVELAGMTWTNSNPATYVTPAIQNPGKKDNKDYLVKIGTNDKQFQGTVLTGTLPEQYGNAVKSFSMVVSSKSGSGTIGVKVGDQTIVETKNTVSWGSNETTEVVSGEFETPVQGDIVITLGESSGAFYFGNMKIEGADLELVKYTSLEITGTPSKTSYFVGDDFSTEGLVVTASNEAGDSKVVTDDVVWSTDVAEGGLTADDTSVKVTATYGELTATKDVIITVAERPVFTTLEATGITKTSYKVGEKLDTAGLVVTAKTADGSDSYIVPTNEYTIDKTEFTIDDAVTGKATITVTYGELKATFEVDVSAMSVAEFRALNDGQNGVVVGTVTGVYRTSDKADKEGFINVYLNDDTAGLLVYSIDPQLVEGEIAIGTKIMLEGARDTFNGVAQLNSPTKAVIVGEGDEIVPVAIKSKADLKSGMDGRLIIVEGLTYKNGNIYGSSGAANVTLELNGENVVMRSQNASAAKDLNAAGLDDLLQSTYSGLPFTYIGNLGWYNSTPQLAPTAMSEFSCPVYDEIKTFIDTYMYMDKTDKNQCLTLFKPAQEALNKLSETARECFLDYKGDNQEIVSASARYHAWSVAVGDQNAASVIMNTVNENKGTIIAVSAVAALGIAGAAALLISRKKRSAKNK